jgi:calcineurin-like phosphoesterase family protein
MAIWFTADTHFSHENIIRYCNRPFKDVDEMNEKMIRNWNAVVQLEDTVFHIGDFSMRSLFKKFRERLNGNVILISGNHDGESPIHSIFIEHFGKMWHLVHNPEEAELDFNICGHVHGLWKLNKIGDKIIYNCGVDVNSFKPVSMKQIVKAIRKTYGVVI